MQTTVEQTLAPFGIKLHGRPPDLRRERRHAIPKGINLKVRTSPQNDLVDAELRDISRSGVGMLSPRILPAGMPISFPFGSERIFAQVRYCSPDGSSFMVGALILEVVAGDSALSPKLNG